ncbi:LexA family transcriptional regulator [Halofilum ochraceum]|uniref:LexA family transcriptional regulator n=1 Tax=Halofilum ochraceum TaxID=1611323 RepID=UPI0008D9EB43|nr:LexA family transcriptional regulator [Halofilum ochraceum]
MSNEETVGDRLRQARQSLGLSQTAAAYRCGWESQSRVSMYERGQRSPDYDDLARIAAAYGVRQEWVLTGEKPIRPGGPIDRGDPGTYHVRRLTLAGAARVGADGSWRTLEPTEPRELAINAPTGDPTAYAVQVCNHHLSPAFRDGEIVVIEPNESLVPGEYVLVKTTDGVERFMELAIQHPDRYVLLGVRDANERVTLSREEIEHIYHVGPRLPASMATVDTANSA